MFRRYILRVLKPQIYKKNEKGVLALMFAVMLSVLMMLGMGAVDIAQSYLVQQRLASAVDTAALAAAASANDASLEARVIDFINANYDESAVGDVDFSQLKVTRNGDKILVEAVAVYTTIFLHYIGIDKIEVEVISEVQQEIKGVEVVLVLDYSGSMNNKVSGRRKYLILEDAVTSLITTVFDRVGDLTKVKIGLVPYDTMVNVGSYGLGEYPDGSYYDEPFVNNPLDLEYGTSNNSQWWGDVKEPAYPNDTEDNAWQMWDMYGAYEHQECYDPDTGILDTTGSCSVVQDDIDDRYNDIDDYLQDRADLYQQYCNWGYSSYCYWADYWVLADYYYDASNEDELRDAAYDYVLNQITVPKRTGSKMYLQPMVNDEALLLSRLNEYAPKNMTSGNLGMAWGWRVISPGFPFTEGATYCDPADYNCEWEKYIVVITDGQNNFGYGGDGTEETSNINTNNRFKEICDNIKDQTPITIYSIIFDINNSNVRNTYKYCASDASKFYEVSSANELIEVYERIGREISHLRLTK